MGDFIKFRRTKEIIVVSLFDGISCGKIALERAGIDVSAYYASEIDRNAINCSKSNYSDIIHIGNIKKIRYENGILFTENGEYDIGNVDLLIGGSPCQTFSMAGTRTGFDGKSKLYWEYSRLLKEIEPKYFLLENVKMKNEWEKIITNDLGVEPLLLNSALVSAQNRERLYWTNVTGTTQPKDKNIKLNDIVESDIVANGAIRGRYNADNSISQCLELRNDGKTNTLTTVQKDNVLVVNMSDKVDTTKKMRVKEIQDMVETRNLTPLEMERLQTLPEGYTQCLSTSQRGKVIGNGWTVDIIAHIFKHIKNTI